MVDEAGVEEVRDENEDKGDDLSEVGRFIDSCRGMFWGKSSDPNVRLACFTLGWCEELLRYLMRVDGGPTGESLTVPEWYSRESRRKKPTLSVQRRLLELRDMVLVVSTEVQLELTQEWLASGNAKSPAGQVLAARDRVRWSVDGRAIQSQSSSAAIPTLQIGDAG